MVALNLKDRFKNGELDLSSCGLKEVPKEITSLKNVTSLNLSNNKISSVGKIIGNLTQLNKLDLSSNAIKGLPENIGNLTNLKYLSLSNNQMATLPASLGNLKNLKCLNLENNNLAPKFANMVGPCQTESQCQQAAKNVLKAFSSSQSDADKKKKPNAEQELKKKKNDKKAQNGSASQTKQKDNNKDRKSGKPSKGIFGTLFGILFSLLKTLFVSVLIIGLGVYILSFYDENRFKAVKSQFYPHWHSAVTRVLSAEQTSHLEGVLLTAGNYVNNTVVTARNVVVVKSKEFYTYVTTDETIRQYVNNVKSRAQELWAQVSGGGSSSAGGGGEQKQKS